MHIAIQSTSAMTILVLVLIPNVAYILVLATKVTFFNELHALHDASGSNASWEQFTEMLGTDPRIGKSHMKVPGPDGKFGYGGHCFPKDTKAFLYYAKKLDTSMHLLKTATKLNDVQRDQNANKD